MAMVSLGSLDDLQPGNGRECAVGERVIAVFRTTDGRLFATQAHCPHAGGRLAEGAVGSRRVICPLHQWKFDLETGVCVSGEEPAQLRTFAVVEQDGQAFVGLD